jgi:predicted DCC family thiol-disulfide oxidoreductase YuxK
VIAGIDTIGAPLVLFDGVCNLCHAAVRWIIAHDREAVFRFASLQSAAAREALGGSGATGLVVDSMVLIDQDGVHLGSEAVLRVARRIGWPWPLAVLCRVLPRGGRDSLYRQIATRRYRWFGRKDRCPVPSEEFAARFLDAAEHGGRDV